MQIMVSIVCMTFNHKDYIKKALDSFLSQKTNFNFEVLVHDDCSTDGTDLIVKEYETKYPDIVKPIYEKENQYSKGIRIITGIMLPRCKGKYLSFCEGDDYWTDSLKLQKQVDYLESHPECTLCIHGAEIVTTDEKRFKLQAPYSENRLVDVEDVLLGGGGFVATNSIVAPMRLVESIPSYINILAIDWVWQMYFASQGTTYYISDIMSAYRKGGKSSWSYKTAKDITVYIKSISKNILVRELFDESTNYKYHDILEHLNGLNEVSMYFYKNTPKKYWSQRSILAASKMSKYGYYNELIRCKFPAIHRVLSLLKTNLGALWFRCVKS